MRDLFRKEVVEKESQRYFGNVIIITPLGHSVVLVLLCLIMSFIIIVCLFGEYSRKERVRGILTPNLGLVRIIPQQAGVFEEVHVESGDVVSINQPLLEIKYDVHLSEGKSLSTELLKVIKSEKIDLIKRLKIIPEQFSLKHERLKLRKKELLAESHRLIFQIENQERIVQIEKNTHQKIKELFKKNAVSKLELTSQETKFLETNQSLNTLKNNRQRLLGEVKDIDIQISMLPIDQKIAEDAVQQQLQALKRSIIQTDAGSSGLIISPVDGTIASIVARKGQPASLQRTAISILPLGGKLQAELYVPSSAAGFVKDGQFVRVLYDAFPYQKFGFYRGKITNISKTVVNGFDLSIPQQLLEPVFIVTVELNQKNIKARGDSFPLQAGMTLSADIILEDRKIWEWILEPFLGGVNR